MRSEEEEKQREFYLPSNTVPHTMPRNVKTDISAGMLRMKDKKIYAPAEMSRERQCPRGNVQYKSAMH